MCVGVCVVGGWVGGWVCAPGSGTFATKTTGKYGTPALRVVVGFCAGISWLTLNILNTAPGFQLWLYRTSDACSSSYGLDVESKRTTQKMEKVMFSQVQILGLKAMYDSGMKNTGEKDFPLKKVAKVTGLQIAQVKVCGTTREDISIRITGIMMLVCIRLYG